MYRPEIDFRILIFRSAFLFAFPFVSLSFSFSIFLQSGWAIRFIQSTTKVERDNRIYSRGLLAVKTSTTVERNIYKITTGTK